jgi:hypothetical protein
MIQAARAEHVAKHGPGCMICGTIPKTRGLQWDHDHKTGQHRGWLCHRCNRNLPAWVTPDWLRRAAAYLEGRGVSASHGEEIRAAVPGSGEGGE